MTESEAKRKDISTSKAQADIINEDRTEIIKLYNGIIETLEHYKSRQEKAEKLKKKAKCNYYTQEQLAEIHQELNQVQAELEALKVLETLTQTQKELVKDYFIKYMTPKTLCHKYGYIEPEYKELEHEIKQRILEAVENKARAGKG